MAETCELEHVWTQPAAELLVLSGWAGADMVACYLSLAVLDRERVGHKCVTSLLPAKDDCCNGEVARDLEMRLTGNGFG